MKKVILLAAVLTLAACDEGHSGSTRFSLATDPAVFSAQMAGNRVLDDALAQLAVKRAKSDDVKSFAQTLIDENDANDALLRPVAQQAGISVPVALTDSDKAKVHALSLVAHDEFDRIFMDTMVDSQRDAFRDVNTATYSSAPALTQYASATLPVLKARLENAERIDVLVGGGLGPTSAQH